MSLDEELLRLDPGRGITLTIGVFDGVHLGHRHLIAELKAQAEQQGTRSGIITFRQHPLSVLMPQTTTPCLTILEAKLDLLRAEGVDEVITLSFTRELADLDARQFVVRLQDRLGMQGLVIGPDFALGRDREGSVASLRALGQEMGFPVSSVPPLIIDGDVVSSTAIRNALAAGDIERAGKMLGRSFGLSGRVIHGDGRGATLGIPTANIETVPEQALPVDGVYATLTRINGRALPSVTNIGKNPTFGGDHRSVEVHILDYIGDLYDRQIAVEFIHRLRGERQFASAEELKKQIAEDIRQGRKILASRSDR
jgi:riboflavin kinase/FMN adenylyltransferase